MNTLSSIAIGLITAGAFISAKAYSYPYFIPYQDIRVQQAQANLLQAEANKAQSQANFGTPDYEANYNYYGPPSVTVVPGYGPQPQINNYNTVTVQPYAAR